MKENSIEEAKRIIEKLISTMKSDREMFDEKTTEKEIYTFFINALEFILSDYKRVLKENEELSLKYYMLYTEKIENLKAQEVKIKSQVIPVQKVKDKIEEYKNILKTCNKAKDIDRIKAINERILELQELLEGRR